MSRLVRKHLESFVHILIQPTQLRGTTGWPTRCVAVIREALMSVRQHTAGRAAWTPRPMLVCSLHLTVRQSSTLSLRLLWTASSSMFFHALLSSPMDFSGRKCFLFRPPLQPPPSTHTPTHTHTRLHVSASLTVHPAFGSPQLAHGSEVRYYRERPLNKAIVTRQVGQRTF